MDVNRTMAYGRFRMRDSDVPTDIPKLTALLAGADHVDVKTIESDATLREFVAGAFGGEISAGGGLGHASDGLSGLRHRSDPGRSGRY